MNRHRKSFKAIQCPGYSHPLTKQLAGVLRQTQGERFTRPRSGDGTAIP